MPEKRTFRPRTRQSGLRDARLIIIAAEGERTEKQYFDGLVSPKYFRNPRVHVEVLPHLTTASSPNHIAGLLDQFRDQYRLNDYDELWLVIDVDRWQEQIAEIARVCQQKSYSLAVSNPCFEIWLLLHHRSLADYEESVLEEFRINKKTGSRTRIDIELLAILGTYNKAKLNPDIFMPHIDTAITNARSADQSLDHRWPNGPGTRVYQLVESIFSKK